MRRSLLLIAAVVAGLLVGCDEERATSIRKNRAEFNEALQLVKLVEQDHVSSSKGLAEYKPGSADFDKADLVAAMKSGNLGQFRDALSDQAEAKLSALKDVGPASQRVSAARLLANLKMASAHRLRTQANAARNRHGSENGFIAAALHAIERADAVSKRRLSSDLAEGVTQLVTDSGGAATKVVELKAEQTRLQGEITDQQKQITGFEGQRDTKFNEGRKLRTQGFKAKGQQAFDLYAKAIALEQTGNELETEAQNLRVGRDLAKAKLVVVESELALVMAWQKGLEDGLSAAEARKQALAKVETDVSSSRKLIGDQIVASFNVVNNAYAKDVIAPLDAAVVDLDAATAALKAAGMQAVSGEDKLAIKMRELAAQLEKLQAQDDKQVALGTIGRAAENVYGRAAAMLPQSFAAIEASVKSLRDDQTALADEATATTTSINGILSDASVSGLQDSNPLAAARLKLVNATRSYLATHDTVVESNKFMPIGSTPVVRTGTPGGPTTPPTPPTGTGAVDNEAAQVLTRLAASLANYKPGDVWDALPASYQTDIEGWVHTFGERMDAELWNAVFGFAKKVVSLAQNKKAYILANENINGLLAQAGPDATDKIEKNWDDVVMLLSIIVNSELADLKKVQTLDVGTFLSGTGAKFMAQADKVSELTEGTAVIKATVSAMKFKVTSSRGDTATVAVEGAPSARSIVMQKVEGSWLPKDLVDEWPEMKQQAEAGLASLDPAQFQEGKGQIMGLLTVVGGMVDNLNNAESQEAFDASVQQLMGLVQSMMGGAGAAPPSN